MLSQENINKIHENGIYRCEPVLKWLPSYKRDTPYWCRNWTFKVHRYKDKYYMYDTYWHTGDEYPVELTDDNFDLFEYLFDLDDVRFVHSWNDFLEYPECDRWVVALDSGGTYDKKYVVRRGAKKIKERVVERLNREIQTMKYDLAQKQKTLERVINEEIDWNYV